jgi:hypothetical protein
MPNQRPQLARIRKERRKFCTQDAAWLSAGALSLGFLLLFTLYNISEKGRSVYDILTSPVPNSQIYSFPEGIPLWGLAVSIVIFLRISYTKLLSPERKIWFRCPNTACPSAEMPDAINVAVWQCGACDHRHEKSGGILFWCRAKVIGDQCSSCKQAPSHFLCPHCNIAILLDETRPRIKAARVPG